eukprot:3512456-Prymnesium_polylepis.1
MLQQQICALRRPIQICLRRPSRRRPMSENEPPDIAGRRASEPPAQRRQRQPLQPLAAGQAQPLAAGVAAPSKPSKPSKPASRDERLNRRANVVVDPCQAAEQRRLLERARLQSTEHLRVCEHAATPPLLRGGGDLAVGDKLTLGSESMVVTGLLGRGTFGTVFAATPVVVSLGRRPPPRPPVAVKLSRPPQLWEWAIHVALRTRLPASELERHAVLATSAHVFGAKVLGSKTSKLEACPAHAPSEAGGGVGVLVQPLARGSLQRLIEGHVAR